jgi:starch synthase
MSKSTAFLRLAYIPTIITIHNAHYQGNFSWSYYHYLPEFSPQYSGLLEWNQQINSLASAVKCAWAVTTVSNGYLDELQVNGWGLEWLFKNELSKSKGVVNGIDALEWNPQTDKYLHHHLQSCVEDFKQAGKREICSNYGLDENLPLFVFIGRLVPDKGVDLIVDVLQNEFVNKYPSNILILGSGNPDIAESLLEAQSANSKNIVVEIKYDEGLAHRLYASADFLLMPSRFEPCGLNQLYAMHYGTIPVVHTVGGLKETVPDVVEKNGRGFCFGAPYAHLLEQAMARAVAFYKNPQAMQELQQELMQIDFSWEYATNQYTQTYNNVISKNKKE